MKRMLLAAAALVATACGATLDPVLLNDDFSAYPRGSDGAPNWDVRSGNWTVTADGFLGADSGGDFATEGASVGNDAWRDYVLTLRFRIVARGSDWRDGPWVGVRCGGAGSGYTVGLYTRNTALHKAHRGRTTGDDNPLAQSPTVVADDQWHALAIRVVGNRIRVELDGKAVLNAVDENHNGVPPVPGGGIVLGARKWQGSTGHTKIIYSKVRVEAIGEVTPAMKKLRRYAPVRKPSLLKFMAARRTRRYGRSPRKVLTFYYTWYGTPQRHGRWVHWANVRPEKHDIATSTHYPAKGAYDSHDPAIIDWHIDLAKANGIDAFIATWWGQGGFDDRAFRILLDRAKPKDFQATVYWESAPGKGRSQVDRAARDLLYILGNYGSHPAFFKHDGKPVIFVYGRVMGQVPLSLWPAIITEASRRYGKDFLLIADGYNPAYARVFDGVHTYNICGWVRDKTPEQLAALSGRLFKSCVDVARRHARISCITIIPGYDDTKIRTPGLNARRQGGATYRVLWEQAIAADPDWVVITSFNEWHEGSEIEPSHEDGDKYIKMTGQWAARFKARPVRKTPIPETSAISPEAAAELRRLYKGVTIGLLPDFGGDVVFWLAEGGVALRELAWDDLLDPATVNATSLPVLIYASAESYRQTLKTQGDVDAALVRYLNGGGLLVAITTQPFPFYYNETGKPVVNAARFGIPIAGSGAHGRADVPAGSLVRGWEEPPKGVELSFALDTKALRGAPKTVPFPDSGDLRWRPCTGAALAKADVYLSLARLVDATGRYYGDGIAYIHHVGSQPKGGKAIYVWKRMPDLIDTNRLLLGLFRLAAEKATGSK